MNEEYLNKLFKLPPMKHGYKCPHIVVPESLIFFELFPNAKRLQVKEIKKYTLRIFGPNRNKYIRYDNLIAKLFTHKIVNYRLNDCKYFGCVESVDKNGYNLTNGITVAEVKSPILKTLLSMYAKRKR